MILLDGRIAREARKKALTERVFSMNRKPRLVIIQVGSDPRSENYIRQKEKFGESIGVSVERLNFTEATSEDDLKGKIKSLNADSTVTGIIVQLPLPVKFDPFSIINCITPEKDADGLTESQKALLEKGDKNAIVPATARGIMSLLKFYGIEVRGKKVAMLGRSRLVGYPTSLLLKNEGAEVSLCHSETPNTKEISRMSDIVVVAIGRPKLIGKDYLKTGQVVVDVGINVVSNSEVEKLIEEIGIRKSSDIKLVGDVDFENIKDIVSAISPVPGGVGPMTVLSLFENVAEIRPILQ